MPNNGYTSDIMLTRSMMPLAPRPMNLASMSLTNKALTKPKTSFMNSKGAGIASAGLLAVSSLIPLSSYEGSKRAGLAMGLDLGYDTAMGAMAAIPGIGTIGAGAMAAGKLLTKGLDAMGVGTDRMTTADAILDSPFAKLTPVGLVNAVGAKKAKTFKANTETIEDVGSSYGGSLAAFEKSGTMSGKKYGLLSGRARRRANRQITESNRLLGIMTGIASEAKDDFAASNNPLLLNRMLIGRTGGFLATAYGKTGLKLRDNTDWAKKIILAMNKTLAPSFKDGGKMNIIPVGALHKELHHLEVDGITTKGIPVVIKEEGGELSQSAEIERDEIIFTLDLTEDLEELRDKYNSAEDLDEKDEIAIEAGKLLAEEILHNTIDKGKLIKSVE